MPRVGRAKRIGTFLRQAMFFSVVLVPFAKSDEVTNAGTQFDRQIAPLFAARCLDCHNGTEKKGGLDLSRVEAATKGGESGAVIEAGKAAESLMWQRVRDGEMPPKKPLTA